MVTREKQGGQIGGYCRAVGDRGGLDWNSSSGGANKVYRFGTYFEDVWYERKKRQIKSTGRVEFPFTNTWGRDRKKESLILY